MSNSPNLRQIRRYQYVDAVEGINAISEPKHMDMFFLQSYLWPMAREETKDTVSFQYFVVLQLTMSFAALAQKTLLLYLSGQYGFQVSNMVCARGEDQNPLHVGWIVSLYILYLNYVIVLC